MSKTLVLPLLKSWSYMIKSDMLKCAVTCFCIYGDLQYKKIIKNVPNIQIFPLLIPNVQLGPLILCRDIFNDYLQLYIMGLVYQHVFLPITKFMVMSRAKNFQIWGHFELFLAYSLPIFNPRDCHNSRTGHNAY